MIDQVGQPDYSLREMCEGLREVRDDLFALSQSARCVATGNPCGTDTAGNGEECPAGGKCRFAASSIERPKDFDAALERIDAICREVQILCDEFDIDPYEYLANDEETASAIGESKK